MYFGNSSRAKPGRSFMYGFISPSVAASFCCLNCRLGKRLIMSGSFEVIRHKASATFSGGIVPSSGCVRIMNEGIDLEYMHTANEFMRAFLLRPSVSAALYPRNTGCWYSFSKESCIGSNCRMKAISLSVFTISGFPTYALYFSTNSFSKGTSFRMRRYFFATSHSPVIRAHFVSSSMEWMFGPIMVMRSMAWCMHVCMKPA